MNEDSEENTKREVEPLSDLESSQHVDQPTEKEFSETNLYFKGLEPSITMRELVEICRPFGTVATAKVIRDSSGFCSGIGFVNFKDREDATRVVEAFQNSKYFVKFALKKRPRIQTHSGLNDEDREVRVLYISNLPRSMSKVQLENILSPYGPILSVEMIPGDMPDEVFGEIRVGSSRTYQKIMKALGGGRIDSIGLIAHRQLPAGEARGLIRKTRFSSPTTPPHHPPIDRYPNPPLARMDNTSTPPDIRRGDVRYRNQTSALLTSWRRRGYPHSLPFYSPMPRHRVGNSGNYQDGRRMPSYNWYGKPYEPHFQVPIHKPSIVQQHGYYDVNRPQYVMQREEDLGRGLHAHVPRYWERDDFQESQGYAYDDFEPDEYRIIGDLLPEDM